MSRKHITTVLEPFNALLLTIMVLIGWCINSSVRDAFAPIFKSKRSTKVKLRLLSKSFNRDVPWLAPVVCIITSIFFVLWRFIND
ncbi:hypothetical protein A8V38_14250 [Vibrio parahaemolyticus]|nr:hypothetical protein [Vibrio parahaemolyticus]